MDLAKRKDSRGIVQDFGSGSAVRESYLRVSRIGVTLPPFEMNVQLA
jgi:hypothetical protein